jgi:MerR family regulatory protein
MRIGEVAERAGVNVETLRYYERRGLLPEPPRRDGGHREYGADVLWELARDELVAPQLPLPPPRGDYDAFTVVPLELTRAGRRLV